MGTTTLGTSQFTTATDQENELNRLLLERLRATSGQQTQVQQSGMNLVNQLLTGGALPGGFAGLAGGITPEMTTEMSRQAVSDISPGLQKSGILDSGTALSVQARTAGDIRRQSAEFNINNQQNLLTQALTGQQAVQQPMVQQEQNLGARLAGLRPISGTAQTPRRNPFLEGLETGVTGGIGSFMSNLFTGKATLPGFGAGGMFNRAGATGLNSAFANTGAGAGAGAGASSGFGGGAAAGIGGGLSAGLGAAGVGAAGAAAGIGGGIAGGAAGAAGGATAGMGASGGIGLGTIGAVAAPLAIAAAIYNAVSKKSGPVNISPAQIVEKAGDYINTAPKTIETMVKMRSTGVWDEEKNFIEHRGNMDMVRDALATKGLTITPEIDQKMADIMNKGESWQNERAEFKTMLKSYIPGFIDPDDMTYLYNNRNSSPEALQKYQQALTNKRL